MDPATLQHLLDQVPTAALALIGLYLFTAGRLHSDAELRALRQDLDTERAAHEQTRAALATANEQYSSRTPLRGAAVGLFPKRRKQHTGHMTPEASLAEAEAALRQQRRKLTAEQQVRRKLDRLADEDDLASLFREALGSNR